MNKGRRKHMESEGRLEARRKDPGRETDAAQEQGKKLCFIEEEKEAQEAREWQEQFMEGRRRAQEARAEEERAQETSRCEEEDDERVRVVLNMEAGSSYFQSLASGDQKRLQILDRVCERCGCEVAAVVRKRLFSSAAVRDSFVS